MDNVSKSIYVLLFKFLLNDTYTEPIKNFNLSELVRRAVLRTRFSQCLVDSFNKCLINFSINNKYFSKLEASIFQIRYIKSQIYHLKVFTMCKNKIKSWSEILSRNLIMLNCEKYHGRIVMTSSNARILNFWNEYAK